MHAQIDPSCGKAQGETALTPSSQSKRLREEGNTAYRSLTNGLAPTLWSARLRRTLDLYQRARDVSRIDDDLASASKNIGKTHWKAAMRSSTDAEQMKHFAAAISAWSDALQQGGLCKSREWVDEVWKNSKECHATAMSAVEELNIDQQLAALTRLSKAVGDALPDCKGSFLLTDVRWMFKRAVPALERGELSLAIKYMKEAAMPLVRAEQLIDRAEGLLFLDEYLEEELEELNEDVFRLQCSCESVQERHKGDALLQSSLQGSESINMDAVYICIDCYKQASILTREQDVLNEAMAEARLGDTYMKVLKKHNKAQEHMKRALELAQSLYPVPVTQEWYKDIRAALSRYQQESAAKDAAERARQREPILQELKTELTALTKAFERGSFELIKHIYATHPPKNPAHVKPETGPEQIKRALLTAISHYHPDKQSAGNYGMKWCVLAEEITKHLNRKYALFNPCAVPED